VLALPALKNKNPAFTGLFEVVTLTAASWNRILQWLREMSLLSVGWRIWPPSKTSPPLQALAYDVLTSLVGVAFLTRFAPNVLFGTFPALTGTALDVGSPCVETSGWIQELT